MRYYGRISGAVSFLKITLIFLGAMGRQRAHDGHFHTYPWLMVLGLILGAAIGIWWLVRIADQNDSSVTFRPMVQAVAQNGQ